VEIWQKVVEESQGGTEMDKSSRKCKGCGVEFMPRRYWQVFHDNECRVKFWQEVHQEVAEIVVARRAVGE